MFEWKITDEEMVNLLNRLYELEQENKKLKIKLKTEKGISCFTFKNIVKSDYIRKDIIRDKIKELEKDIEIFCNDGCDTKHFTYCKEILKELLKEGE